MRPKKETKGIENWHAISQPSRLPCSSPWSQWDRSCGVRSTSTILRPVRGSRGPPHVTVTLRHVG